MSLLDLEHSGKLCKDLIIYGSNYGSVGARTALCCSVFAAIAIVAHFNVLTKLVLPPTLFPNSVGFKYTRSQHNRLCHFFNHPHPRAVMSRKTAAMAHFK